MKILAIIPARGASKGIPKKNIYPINGKPLICYTLECVQQCKSSFDVVVSTDSDEIASTVLQHSDIDVIRRPGAISGDEASTESALLHTLDEMDGKGKIYDCVLTLQVTSPLRKPDTIDAFISDFVTKQKAGYDALFTLTADYSDYWVSEGGEFRRLFPNAPRRRQDRVPIYAENSAIYITTVKALRQTSSVLGTKCAGFLIPPDEAIDINDLNDIFYAELLLRQTEGGSI
jgi:CMP-N-acetylneuraminic acid synthetase